MFTKERIIPRTAYRKIVGSIAITVFAQRGAGGPANAAPRPAAAAPLEDRRPPLFLKETFPMPKKEEIYISRRHLGSDKAAIS